MANIWYQMNSVKTPSLSTTAWKYIGNPIQFNGIKYGVEENPWSYIYAEDGASYKQMYNTSSGLRKTFYGSDNGGSVAFKHGSLFKSAETPPNNSRINIFSRSSSILSGKYKVKQSCNNITFNGWWYEIPHTINGVFYDGLFVGQDNTYSLGANEISSFNYKNYIGSSLPDVFNLTNITTNYLTLTPIYENGLAHYSIGTVVDFGSGTEVPLELFQWVENNFTPIYPYTYTIKTQDGATELSVLREAPAMVDATPSVVGNVKTLTMTGVNGQTYKMTWESETPAGKQFLGLAYVENETRASIPTGRTTPVTWDGSLTVYEAYGTYRPPVTTFDINLYQSSAEVNRVDKTDFLTSVGTLSGVLREECSIIEPSIMFKQTPVPSFNYVYIAAFGRYYYVTGITSVSKDIWRMSLSCDVLMTWKNEIRALTAIIARQENSFNPMLLDIELPAQANQNITVTEFPTGGFSTGSAIEHPFLLTVVGA